MCLPNLELRTFGARLNMEKAKTLTKRESEIAELFAWGASKKDIANRLFVSERTVENHTRNRKDSVGPQDTEYFRRAHKNPDAVVQIKHCQYSHGNDAPDTDIGEITLNKITGNILKDEIIPEPQAKEKCQRRGKYVHQHNGYNLGKYRRIPVFMFCVNHFITS